jgi:glycosyltransferase involved in cell wall biosynthesis
MRGNNMDKLMVSICCMTYNHEKYISEAIESFLMQKTNFEYEILIHDDASTDNTAKIIKEYEKKYPKMIKPICQKENQYSKNIKIDYTFNFPRAKGKYIAICEGDDYWTDPLKLQKQVDYMELHPECSLCTHAAKLISSKGRPIGNLRPHTKNKSYSVEEVIIGGGGLFPTNSMLFPTTLVKKMPEFYMNAPVGDGPLTIFLALKGNVYYLDSCMSVYRYMAEGSWTSRMSINTDAKKEHLKRIKNMYREFDEYTNNMYSNTIDEKLLLNEFIQLQNNFDIKKIKLTKYKKHYSNLSLIQKAKIYIVANFPGAIKLRRKLKWE